MDADGVPRDLSRIDIQTYDQVVVALSGGKDSVASTLALIDKGLDPSRLIFFHHRVDGGEGSTLMDWPSTEPYCEAFARHIGGALWWSWREGGFEREMLRDNEPTGAVCTAGRCSSPANAARKARTGRATRFSNRTAPTAVTAEKAASSTIFGPCCAGASAKCGTP